MFGKNRLVFGFLLFLSSCVEEVDLSITEVVTNIENILIVEGTVTNELKNQRITLSKIDTILDTQIDSVFNPFTPIRDIDRDLVRYEENAQVTVEDDAGLRYPFNEIGPGIYESAQPFAAEIGRAYQLRVIRANGQRFFSTPMQIEGFSNLENVYAEKVVNNDGEEGIGIFIDNVSEMGVSENFRFKYEETYKIIAPNWTPFQFQLTNYDPCALPVPTYDLDIVERSREERVCYRTEVSNRIVQAQLAGDNGSGIKRFMVRFISKDNFAISHRYSIEVEQLVAGLASFGFYEQLNNFSQTGNIFSQVQPGFLEGNILSEEGTGGTVLGFFDVVSSTKKRLFFNYTDFYPNEPLPPFPFNCNPTSAPESHVSYCFQGFSMNNCPQSIIERVNLGLISFTGNNGSNIGACPGPFMFVPTVCGDCTQLGSNSEPEFWTEE